MFIVLNERKVVNGAAALLGVDRCKHWGTFFKIPVYERVGVSLVDLLSMVGKSIIAVCGRT